ncbi:hypothetical protein ACFVYF_24540 [Streptomyces sp. NPDC058274]|uniref:hypothetical protein n=1 Tax=Streptomyces sp. NPDC058274 TaxID=3346416 RepID=UPI0036E4AF63
MAVGSPGQAYAQQPGGLISSPSPPVDLDGHLGAGWRITGADGGRELSWRSSGPLPMGDAAVEFYAGDRSLGRPVADEDRHTLRLPLDGVRLGSAEELQVRAGGHRLDKDEPVTGTGSGSRRSGAAVKPAARPPANPVDPGRPGAYRTVTGEYQLKSVRLPGFSAPVEMRAVVVAPTGATGHRPLALFLHGRHYTCFNSGGEATGDWPCRSGWKAVPSYRGYLRDQKLLASQGYVTVSISANGINGQDYAAEDGGAQARSSLVRLHLARWASWAGAGRASAPAIVRSAPPADLSRVLLVGHSRGGEGVNRAALDSLDAPPADQDGYHGPTRWKIRGTVLIGPTIFGRNPVPDVPSMTILPGCDGDVSDLQGELYVDGTRGVSRGAALHSAVYVVGANHNFFNSEWTPGQAKAPAEDDFWADDRPDPVCSPGTATRLTAARQRAAGATYIAAAARVFVGADDRVRPLLDGSNVRAASAGPARVLTHAVGARRTSAFLPEPSAEVDGGRVCTQVDVDAAAGCLPTDAHGTSPHFTPWAMPKEPGRYAVALKWSAAGSQTRVRPAQPVSVAGADALALRIIVPPNTSGTRMDIAVTDASGRRADLGQMRVDGLPGTDRTSSYWAREVRVPLTAATRAGLDLKRVASLELTSRSGAGRAWLMDSWGWRPGTPAVRPAALPRVDLGRLTVKEGDSDSRTYRMPVRVSGHGEGRVRLFVADPVTDEFKDSIVTVRPGSRTIDVPVEVRGNTRFDYDVAHNVFVKALNDTVVGSYEGGVTAQNDDPMPTSTVTPVADKVVEGQSLTWRVSLSEAADTDMQSGFLVLPVTAGHELSTTDADPTWFEENTGESPQPSRALSTVEGLYLPVTIPAGQLSAEVKVPTVSDGVAEPEESLRLRWTDFSESDAPQTRPVVTGTVRDAA